MKDTFNNVVIYNGYPLSVVVAVTFHSVILALLLYLQSSKSPEALELVQPTVVKALLIQENPQVANERKRLERQQQQNRTREREVAQQAAEAERQRQEQADSQAEEQRKARELASLRQRQEQERLDADQLVREREEQNALEQEQRRQRDLAQAQRQQESRDRERQRQIEAADAAAAELASSEFEMVQSGMAIIQQAVQSVWSRPPSARNGMRAILQIRMLPTGELIDAVITESSGDPAFDRSAENAVYSAAPFRELQALPSNVFNENFRSLSLIFQPEDLLN
ncbi:MAG: cell envelope integrity protein TolA [Proteobacteria bacterium]|jgi:colicin import membrane protein|nr:cell envelope integrity protein TolA [Pseudomonadota bacterium]MDA1290465.1 cell envelope integrity protein TolA [Pseudomonadota bacterium]